MGTVADLASAATCFGHPGAQRGEEEVEKEIKMKSPDTGSQRPLRGPHCGSFSGSE